jgi:hypothetical protein
MPGAGRAAKANHKLNEAWTRRIRVRASVSIQELHIVQRAFW